MIFTPERGEISIGKRSARLGGRERKSSARLFYLTRAVDGHYFIGITVDISSRFREAEAGRGVVRGGCRCTLRCAVSITHPALSAPPLIAVFVAAHPISLTPTSFDPSFNPYHSSPSPFRVFSPYSYVYASDHRAKFSSTRLFLTPPF